ncbi:Calcipressin [Sparassis latifolia]|uniref:Calcipressin n=1 Tax=Sparassis crispa TaxID=139825 RepID=A0A401GKW7_9APHY|nr:Uncharacterized protein SCP_0411990 [Sparassis crispa]GBE82813.1 Uncharacterized protein SCP_0411990 [Sparassis crispa]
MTPNQTFATPPSPPSSHSASPTADSSRTNTLIITQLPAAFFAPAIQEALRDYFALYGAIHAWAPLKAFSRVLLVYYSEDDAERAKQSCDRLIVGSTQTSPEMTLRVYRADPTPIRQAPKDGMDDHYLRPPPIEKNFLISPPGSPPVGWEQIREEPPNSAPLADDLISALRKLEVEAVHHHHGSGLEVLLEPQEGVGIGVYVEDCDSGEEEGEVEEDWVYGETSPARAKWRPMSTSRPPMSQAVGA